MVEPIQSKVCTHCKKIRLLILFPKAGHGAWKGKYVSSWCSDCHRDVSTARRTKMRQDAFRAYSRGVTPSCECCEETEEVFLCLDHPSGNGKEHRAELGVPASGAPFFEALHRAGYPPGLRILCCNCNMATRYGRVCPHQQRRDAQLQEENK